VNKEYKNLRSSLNPNVQRGSIFCGTICSVVTTRTGLVDEMLNNSSPNHGCSASEETKRDLLESTEVDTGAAEKRIDLSNRNIFVIGHIGVRGTKAQILTRRSQMGMKMTRAKGSRLERTSLGRPWVDMVAAWEVKLLFSWLYVSPVIAHVSSV
jgi:hypothetical protein